MARSPLAQGIKDGFPIGLGYLSVAFSVGITAVRLGLPIWSAVVISLTNLTSAGEVAGIQVIGACGTLLEMFLTQLVINLRYALMGVSLSQKLDGSFTTANRMLTSFGITDECYAVAISKPGLLSAPYMTGLMILPIVGWTGGTAIGAIAGQLLPAAVSGALGMVLYGMFLAIIIPVARSDGKVLLAVIISGGISTLLYYFVPAVSSGFAVIISALLSAILCAWLCPIKEKEETA